MLSWKKWQHYEQFFIHVRGANPSLMHVSVNGRRSLRCILSADRDKLVKEVSSLFGGKLNILIKNAGTNDFSFLVNINLQSAFHLSQLAHPLLIASGAGRIVFEPSICSVVSVNTGCPIYSAAKGAQFSPKNLCSVRSCSKCCDLQYKGHSVAPWFIRTPMTEDVLKNENVVKELAYQTPIRRVGGPGEVSSAVAFLCAIFTTGQAICIDGGISTSRPESGDNNILYPREDRDQKILLYACRNCDHQEIADDNCVYRNEVHHSVAERTQVLQDVAADPTLPRTKAVTCTVCKHPEAVFFQATSRGEEGMTLFFVCCNPNCGHRWRD
ncbi:hypothetical protein SADUNF_Sadunf08G0086200 [Salix dunnii]|uniref:TFIIS-type domain-containing protein n=1 Tax=Salix dunnii TaxID=1413687 RepID=A0A835JXJ0_9ROSI|nr:hypothetical protein SADUNF_Sadunf08G0086200 [Salix dunnii]